MGIRFFCEHCHKQLNVKSHQAGEEGACPECDQPIRVPGKSTILSKAQLARKKRKKAEHRARQRALADDQATIANLSGTQEFNDLNEQLSTQIKTSSELSGPASLTAQTSQAVGQSPTNNLRTDGSKGNFLLDKPLNPWLEPNAPDPVETGLKKVWYVRHPKNGEDGPIKGKQIAKMLEDKKIVPGCFVWREDWQDWLKAELVFRQLQQAENSESDSGLFTNPKARIPKSYQQKAHAEENARKRRLAIGVVAVVVGLATITLLVWLLITLS